MNILKKSFLLTGMKHCGKSSIGKILAAAFCSEFTDIDDLAEEIYHKEIGESLTSREIYHKGSEIFQSFEQKAAERITSLSASRPIAAAAGGGICDNRPAIELLKQAFVFIYIEEDAEILFERIVKGGRPAFLSKDNPLEDFLKLYKKRTEMYDNLCDIKVKAAGRTIEEISRELVQRLREKDYAG